MAETSPQPPPGKRGSTEWVSPSGHRILLDVDHRGVERLKRPATVRIDFPKALRDAKAAGEFDPYTVEVIAYDASGRPIAYDASREGHERYLVPHRVEPYYGVEYVDLSFVVPDPSCTRFAVYFDTIESGLGKPERYAGLVGDGDWFRIGYTRREIGASHMCCFASLDGDATLGRDIISRPSAGDLFKVTVEPYIYCYENAGGGRFIYRGRLTSARELFTLPMSPERHRSWPTITFADWDGDGDSDLFVSFCDGDDYGHVVRFENITSTLSPSKGGGQITFANRGRLLTESGQPLGDKWFAAVTVVDWDGDGVKDIVMGREGGIEFYRNLGDDKSVADIRLADGVRIDLPGDIKLRGPRVECIDFDGDGDLDLVIAHQGHEVYYFENIGTRTEPKFAAPVQWPSCGGGHGGVKVADFDGDGELEYVVSSVWESTTDSGRQRQYARLYKRARPRVGANSLPTHSRAAGEWSERDAYSGCPYTECVQTCDASRQNTVRAVDWDNDGRIDLIASGERGMIRLFRNTTNNLFPVFADSEVIASDLGAGIRSCICDWNNDGKKDIVFTNWSGHVYVLLNQGTDDAPVFGEPITLQANGKPIDGTLWCSVLVCDWDGDGRKDLIMGMGGEGKKSEHYDWPHLNADPSQDKGFLFFKNIGTDAEPVLDRPEWITAGPQGEPLDCALRPNLGSFVDWDGDGRKDLIACEFESIVRFYRNVGGVSDPDRGNGPVLADGIEIVRPKTVMTISGADAVDWHGDGDLDIVTGQGHGGSGLRFYARGYIEDTINDTSPSVTAGRCEVRP